MFDIGFSELMVIGVVALIVIGPGAPAARRAHVGHLAGRLQRYVADVKADINREIELDELRKMQRLECSRRRRGIESSVQSELNKTRDASSKPADRATRAAGGRAPRREPRPPRRAAARRAAAEDPPEPKTER